MNKKRVRCWKINVSREAGGSSDEWFTVPDFGDAFRLFICSGCGARFAVDPEEESYRYKSFEAVRSSLNCPECRCNLGGVMPYPEHVWCMDNQHLTKTNFAHDQVIPPYEQSEVVEFWNPIS